MSIGMSYDEFWYGDTDSAKFYIEAHELREQRDDFHSWRLGKYVYDAIICCAPYLNSIKPTEPRKYNEEPYSIVSKREPKTDEEIMMQGLEHFKVVAEINNSRFKET